MQLVHSSATMTDIHTINLLDDRDAVGLVKGQEEPQASVGYKGHMLDHSRSNEASRYCANKHSLLR